MYQQFRKKERKEMTYLVMKHIFFLYIFIYSCKAKYVEIERKSVINDTKSHMFLSIDKFENHDKDRNQAHCESFNATCNGKECNKCACKNFKTFLSHKDGCVSKEEGDNILTGKHSLCS